jgi:transglutaminase-like putative cysteine protease
MLAWLSVVAGTPLLSAPGKGALEWSDETVYRVTIDTSFDIPRESSVKKVRLWHGLPLEKPWSEGEHKSAARSVVSEPAGYNIDFDRESGHVALVWEERVPAKGGRMSFRTTFETTSVTRDIDDEAAEAAGWKTRRLRKIPGMNDRVIEQARLLLDEPSPVHALRKFSSWLRENVRGDASVTYATDDVEATLSNGRGMCGHFVGVMLQFAEAIGIPARKAGGMTLKFADGGRDQPLFWLNPTYSNNHAWLEFEIPGLGWVEAEASGRDKMFRIPRHYIHTRGRFQNYKLELLDRGKWIAPSWRFDGEKFVSEINLTNVISFEVIRGLAQQGLGSPESVEIPEAQRSLPSPTDSP